MHVTERILVVDDDPDMRELVSTVLAEEGFEVHCVDSGAAAIELVEQIRPSIVVLDVVMPGGMSGKDVCRALRKQSTLGIIFVSGRGDDIDRIVGLELGADDYLAKPFHPRELVARVQALSRRLKTSAAAPSTAPTEQVSHGDLTLDLARFTVKFKGVDFDLTRTEFMILKTLLTAPGRVYSRQELIERAYGPGVYLSERTIDSHVRRLRSKFSAAGGDPIGTVRGLGYKIA